MTGIVIGITLAMLSFIGTPLSQAVATNLSLVGVVLIVGSAFSLLFKIK